MIDLKAIRKQPEKLDEMLSHRGQKPLASLLLDLDETYRHTLRQLQEVQAEKNQLDRCIAGNKNQAKEMDAWIEQASQLKVRQAALEQAVKEAAHQLNHHLHQLPNWVDPQVPIGRDEHSNREILRWGTPKTMPWALDHVTLGKKIRGLDFEQAAHVSGARFVYLMGPLARLERALIQWMLDTHINEFGFLEMTVPYLVKSSAVFGTGQLPKMHSDLFCTQEGLFLIPTGEVSLVNWAANKTFEEKDLPLCLVAATPCFRSEAGAAGKDTHGLMRHHQFHKVELVVIGSPEQAAQWHEKMVAQSETLLQRLELPYRRMALCSGDMGMTATCTYDLEVWVPSENRYREIASCSQCGDYQARRLHIKIKQPKGFLFAHTLNASGLPSTRTLLALMENHQQEDGTIKIPSVLHPYLEGERVLRGGTLS